MSSIDVIIPTHNRPAQLRRCLEALARQSRADFGVIIADDASSPPVAATLNADEWPFPLRGLRLETNGGAGAARNAAVAASTAEFVVFVDDDVEPHPEWLSRLVTGCERGSKLAVFGPLLAPKGWRPTPWNLWEARTLARSYRKMMAGIFPPGWRQFFTGNAILRRSVFLEAGGFDESFTRAEDIELGVRLEKLGCEFIFEPHAIGWHHARRSAARWLSLPEQYAHFDVAIGRKHPELGWLDVIREELAGRRGAMRAATNLTPSPAAGLVAHGLVAVARGLYALKATGPAMRSLSVAYDLVYRRALRAALQPDAPAAPAEPQEMRRGHAA